eukprot:3086385-Rhodomonas_salina.1
MQVDRCWHETDFGGLVYQDIKDDEAYYRQGVRAKKFARDFSLKVELGRRHVQMAASATLQPMKTEPGGALEGERMLCQALGTLHHLPVPCPGEPSQKQPVESDVAMVLVVSATRPQTQGDYDTLPLCVPTVRRR